jgi:hypothetical protein
MGCELLVDPHIVAPGCCRSSPPGNHSSNSGLKSESSNPADVSLCRIKPSAIVFRRSGSRISLKTRDVNSAGGRGRPGVMAPASSKLPLIGMWMCTRSAVAMSSHRGSPGGRHAALLPALPAPTACLGIHGRYCPMHRGSAGADIGPAASPHSWSRGTPDDAVNPADGHHRGQFVHQPNLDITGLSQSSADGKTSVSRIYVIRQHRHRDGSQHGARAFAALKRTPQGFRFAPGSSDPNGRLWAMYNERIA